MAITAVAAIAGAAATAAGVTATTLAMISVGVTAVGLVTKSKALMKIGGGLGLGAMAANFVGLAGTPAAAAAETAAASSGATGFAEGGEVAANAAANASVAEAAPIAANAQQIAATAPIDEMAGTLQAPMDAPASGLVDNAARAAPATPAAASGPAPIEARTTPAADAFGRSAEGLGPKPIADAAGVKPIANAMPELERSSSWFDKMGQFWNQQTPTGKLAIGQAASGLVGGVGQGALRYMAASDDREWQQQQIDQRRRDRGFVPSLTPSAR